MITLRLLTTLCVGTNSCANELNIYSLYAKVLHLARAVKLYLSVHVYSVPSSIHPDLFHIHIEATTVSPTQKAIRFSARQVDQKCAQTHSTASIQSYPPRLSSFFYAPPMGISYEALDPPGNVFST